MSAVPATGRPWVGQALPPPGNNRPGAGGHEGRLSAVIRSVDSHGRSTCVLVAFLFFWQMVGHSKVEHPQVP